MVTAETSSNFTATGYNGTVHFSTTDTAALLPASATITSGVGTFSVTLPTAANDQSITVTDTVNRAITGTAKIGVLAGPTIRLVVSAPAVTVTGIPVNFTVMARDVFGNVTG